jgi:hypothetical protein
MQGVGICVVGVGLMVGISYNTDSSFRAEIAYFVSGLLLFGAGMLIQGKKK